MKSAAIGRVFRPGGCRRFAQDADSNSGKHVTLSFGLAADRSVLIWLGVTAAQTSCACGDSGVE